MAHSNQARKRIRQNTKRQLSNKACASAMRTQIKRVMQAIDDGDKAAATAALPHAFKRIDKAAKNNVIHRKTAARKKSVIQSAVNRLA